MLKKIILICFVFACYINKAQVDTAVKKAPESIPKLTEVFKPKVSLGFGMLSFHGDLYANHIQSPWTSRIGYDINVSQQLSKAFQLNLNILFGKLGANEWLANRQENFESEIRSGGIGITYDFGNFISEKSNVRPYISLGINSLEFLSKTDLLDKNGNKYYYWSDGSIKNIDENAVNASTAINLVRDYTYETDIRELNKDGFGKYPERAWSFPVGVGVLMKVTDRVDFKIGMKYYFTTTDYIDGISNNSLGNRIGNKQTDNFIYSSFALQYDLVLTNKNKLDTLPKEYFKGIDWLAIDNSDYDEDGVIDTNDKCQGTAKGLKVNEFGCPLDDDKDGVANNEDEELNTPEEMAVNIKGVSLDDDYWQNWYLQYIDSVSAEQKIVGNFYQAQKDSVNNTKKDSSDVYTIELARYMGPVPEEEMTNLLSIGDIKSTLLPDGSTVLYTAGTYKKIQNAVKRKNEYKTDGFANAKIGSFKNNDFVTLSDSAIDKLIANEKADSSDLLNNEFGKGDIVYRVQLGAYKHKISKNVFKNVVEVLEVKGDDGLYHYTTKGFKTIENAAAVRADLHLEGYKDAFITAYKDGKRIPLKATKATVETKEKEDIKSIPSFSSIDKNLVEFRIQLGTLRKTANPEFEERIKSLNQISKKITASGSTRYTAGIFNNYSKADDYRNELVTKGYTDAFVIAIFKGEIISIQEAQELLK